MTISDQIDAELQAREARSAAAAREVLALLPADPTQAELQAIVAAANGGTLSPHQEPHRAILAVLDVAGIMARIQQ